MNTTSKRVSTNDTHKAGTATRLLIDWSNGDESARERLFELLYDEFLLLARRHVYPNQTLEPADLVHALWERFVDVPALDLSDFARPSRACFFALAVRVMKDRVCDYLRKRHAKKRGGTEGVPHVAVNDMPEEDQAGRDLIGGDLIGGAPYRRSENRLIELILHQEFNKCLARLPERQRAVVEARVAGLTLEKTAEWMGLGVATVKRDWAAAVAKLRLCLGEKPVRTAR
jgi:RNA polymerase sigma factor (sigma-70 family)